ncbi:MAG: hypothetical protein AAF541_09055 [Pseudomonadota bacterium]
MTRRNARKLASFAGSVLALVATTQSAHADWDLSTGLEHRYFPRDRTALNAVDNATSVVALLKGYQSYGPDSGLTLELFGRHSFDDSSRSHRDVRELWFHRGDHSLEIGIGVTQEFWGVTESHHLVNVLNQVDVLEDLDGEDYLGQPMVKILKRFGSSSLGAYVLPYFRPREFHDAGERLGTPFEVLNQQYESGAEEWHTDYAVRWFAQMEYLDLGVAYFSGTDREPVMTALDAGITPIYHQIEQVTMDAQVTVDRWLFKAELLRKTGYGAPIFAYVAGFEYTWYQLTQQQADVGLVVEHLYDDRPDLGTPQSVFDDDWFIGARLTLNNTADTNLLVGVYLDRERSERIFRMEFSHRITDGWSLDLQATTFRSRESGTPIYLVRHDDFISLTLTAHIGIRR